MKRTLAFLLSVLLLTSFAQAASASESFEVDSFISPSELAAGGEEGEEPTFLFLQASGAGVWDYRFRNDFLNEDVGVFKASGAYYSGRFQFDGKYTFLDSSGGSGSDRWRVGAASAVYFSLDDLAFWRKKEESPKKGPRRLEDMTDSELEAIFDESESPDPLWLRLQVEWQLRRRGSKQYDNEIGLSLDTNGTHETFPFGYSDVSYFWNIDRDDHFFSWEYSIPLVADAIDRFLWPEVVLELGAEKVSGDWDLGVVSPGFNLQFQLPLADIDRVSGLTVSYRPAYHMTDKIWNHEIGLSFTMFFGNLD